MINAVEKYNQYKLYIGLVNAIVSELPTTNLIDGDIYILSTNDSVNIYYHSSWRTLPAVTGMLCVLKTDSNIYIYSNGDWTSKSTDISKAYLDAELAKKVNKVEGYSLVSDSDITNIQSHLINSDIHVTWSNKVSWDSKANGIHNHTKSDITDFLPFLLLLMI